MAKYKPAQRPVKEGKCKDGRRWQIYEEFGNYGVYVGGKMKSIHVTLQLAEQKIDWLENKE